MTGFPLVRNEGTHDLRLRALGSRQIAIAIAMAQGKQKIALELSRMCVAGYQELGDAGGEAACLLSQRWAEMEGGDSQAAENTLQRAHLAAAEIPTEARMSLADYILMGQCFLSFSPSDYRRAISYFEKALTLARDQQDRFSEAFVLDRLGSAEIGREYLSKAEEHLEAALKTARTVQEEELLALCLQDSALLYQKQGRSHEAKSLLAERDEIVSRSGDRSQPAATGETATLATEAAAALESERWAAAADLSRACAASYKLARDNRGEILCLLGLGRAELHRGNHQQALDALHQGLSALTGKLWGTDLEMSCRLLLAESYLARQLYNEAVTHLEHGLSLSRSIQDRFSEAAFLERLGFVETQRERWREAEEYLKAALAIAREIPAAEDLLALSLRHITSLYKSQGRFLRAAELLEEAAELAQDRTLLTDETSSLQLLGAVYLDLHKYDSALISLRKAEALLVREKLSVRLWVVRKEIGRTLAKLGKLPEALALFEAAIEHYRSLGDEVRLPSLLADAARILARLGRSQEQRAYLEEALYILRRAGDRTGEADILSELGHFEFQRNSYDEGLKRFEEALSLYRAIRSNVGEMKSLFNSAHLYFDLGRAEEAQIRYERALSLARELQSDIVEASILRDMARLLIFEGRFVEAYSRIEEALMLARRIGSPPEEIDALKMKGDLLGRCSCGRDDEAFTAYSEALSLSKRLPDPREKLKVLISIGLLQLSRGSPAAAVRTFEEVLEGRRSIHSELQESVVLKLLANAYQDLGQLDRSIELYRQAFAAESSILDRTSTDDFLLHQARHSVNVAHPLIQLLVSSGRHGEAFAVAEDARSRAFLRQIRSRPPSLRGSVDSGLLAEEDRLRAALSELDREIRSEMWKPFNERDQSLLETLSSEIDEARQRYETVLIRLKQTNPEDASLIRPAPLSLSDVQRLLDRETTLVEYFVLLDETLVWVIDQESYHLLQLPLSAEALYAKVALWHGRIAGRAPGAELESALYQDLIAPLEPYLRHQRLLLVPHESLHWLSFAALRDAAGIALVERFSLTYLPSASILPFLAAKRSPNAGRLLTIGDPDGSLPYAASEARTVAALYGTQAVLGRQASEALLRQRSRGVDVLHIATHSTLDSARPLFSRLQLAPSAEDDGNLELHEVFGLDLTGTNLVVLSGCDTGRGSLEHGVELVGWGRAFLHAGAPAVLTTLWPIDDAASAALMKSFHRHFRDGLSAADSLRTAQREIAREERWRSSYFWAGFTLVGDAGETARLGKPNSADSADRVGVAPPFIPAREPLRVVVGARPVTGEESSHRRLISMEISAARAIARRKWEEAIQICRECSDGYRALGDGKGEALCLLGMALGQRKKGDGQASAAAMFEGLVASARHQESSSLPLSHHILLAEVYLALPPHFEEAVAHLEKALLLARAQQDRFAEALILNRLGSVALNRGLLAQAAEPLEAALAIARKDRVEDLLGGFLYDLAALCSKLGRFARAAELLEEASALARRRDEVDEEAASLEALGGAYLALHESDRALTSLLRADSLLVQRGALARLWIVRKDMAQAFVYKGELTRALELYNGAIEYYRRVDEEWQNPPLLVGASEILGKQGRPGVESVYLEEALRIWRDMGHKIGEANILVKLGLLDLMRGSPEEALNRFEDAIAASRTIKSRTSEGGALLNSARAYFDLGCHEEARLRYEQTLEIARELGDSVLEENVLRGLERF